jgi:hypothetical protein
LPDPSFSPSDAELLLESSSSLSSLRRKGFVAALCAGTAALEKENRDEDLVGRVAIDARAERGLATKPDALVTGVLVLRARFAVELLLASRPLLLFGGLFQALTG